MPIWGKKKSSGSGEHARAKALEDSLQDLDDAMEDLHNVREDEWSEPPTGVHGPDSEIGRAVAESRNRLTIPPKAQHWGKVAAGATLAIAALKAVASFAQEMAAGSTWPDALAKAIEHLPTLGL